MSPVAELLDHAPDCPACEGEEGWNEITEDLEFDSNGRVVGNVRVWTPCPLLRRPNRRSDDRATVLYTLNAR